MNKTETQYAARLKILQAANEIAWWDYECMKFVLGERTTFLPDFMVVALEKLACPGCGHGIEVGRLQAHEVKKMWYPKDKKTGQRRPRAGFTDDARVKIKTAAKRFPFVDFSAWILDKGGNFVREQFKGNQFKEKKK